MSQPNIKIEVTPSSTCSCGICKERLKKGELRVNMYTKYHLQCFADLLAKSPEWWDVWDTAQRKVIVKRMSGEKEEAKEKQGILGPQVMGTQLARICAPVIIRNLQSQSPNNVKKRKGGI